jgi:hypothetical protein
VKEIHGDAYLPHSTYGADMREAQYRFQPAYMLILIQETKRFVIWGSRFNQIFKFTPFCE